ncbi:DUF2163 domain-containing protein [Qipengyuania sediminis]|uniref:DUF2163 domain-containing protein n=1 Tax=Qipengyuania sediminis TaxID=1532023 RepID=UPI00105993C8|nr:DUF2163 domain-containing protein [Qipengyuania sediminis]
MSRALLDRPLDTVASFWRIHREDGVALGFTTHDRDLVFGGLLHRAAPGLTPSAIRRSSGLADDGAEVEGALAHDCIAESDLAAGRYDNAAVAIGAVCWETLEHQVLYRGTIESLSRDGAGGFAAELVSAKASGAIAVYGAGTGWRRTSAPPAPAGGAVQDAEARAVLIAIVAGLRHLGIFG